MLGQHWGNVVASGILVCLSLGHWLLTLDIDTVLVECWASVADHGPTFNQHRVNVPCFLGAWDRCWQSDCMATIYFFQRRARSICAVLEGVKKVASLTLLASVSEQCYHHHDHGGSPISMMIPKRVYAGSLVILPKQSDICISVSHDAYQSASRLSVVNKIR